MAVVDLQEAASHLAELLDRAGSGEEIVIAENGKPRGQLVALASPPAREFGQDRGLFEVPDDFDAPLPEDFLKLFNG